MRPAGGWQPPLRRAETIVPSSFYRIRCPGLRFCGCLRRREKGGQAHGEDKPGAPPAARHKKFTITRLKKTAQYGKVVT